MTFRFRPGLSVVLGALTACGGGPPGIGVPQPVDRPGLDEIVTRVYLIGDAGAPKPGDQVLEALAREAALLPDRTTVVFLGDNVYQRGLPADTAPDRAEADGRLDRQIEAVTRARARGIFVPGNHDWAKHGPDGLAAVARAEVRIEQHRGMELVPDHGCPGPSIRDLPGLRLVLIDTHWWLHAHAKGCADTPPEQHLAALSAAVQPESGAPVVVAGHHPLASGGTHGGHFPWTAHIFPLRALKRWAWFPLPIIGSIYPLLRASGVSDQDLAGDGNVRMRHMLQEAMAVRPPLVFAAGHEHTLQVIRGTAARHLLVSGTGYWGHTDYVSWSDSTAYASSVSGFMRLDVTGTNGVRLAVIGVDRTGTAREVYAEWLLPRGGSP